MFHMEHLLCRIHLVSGDLLEYIPIPRLSARRLERSLRNSINSHYLLRERNLERNTNSRRTFEQSERRGENSSIFSKSAI